MAHAPGRSILPPFTRRGPPTEDEERKALEERRAASRRRQAAELLQPRSIPRTAFDPAHPTINPPGGRENGPPTQPELTEADKQRQRRSELPIEVRRAINERDRIERNRRLREANLPEEELPSERRERSKFNRAEAQRKFEERRKALGLPPTSKQRRESVKTEAARHALLDGNTEDVPPLQGSLANATRRGQADPKLFDHGQIVRTTVNGRETFQRWNAVRRDFTPVTIDPLTGGIAIDTFDVKALSDAAVADSFNLRISSLRALAADPDLDPESRKQLEFVAIGMEAIKEATGTAITVEEGLKQAKALYSQAAPFIKFEEDEIPSVLKGLDESVTPVEGFPGWFWTRDDKGNYKIQQAKVEEEVVVPTTSQEFFSQGDLKQQTSRFFTFRKQAVEELEGEAQTKLDEAVARFSVQESARVATAQKTAKTGETVTARPFPGPSKPPAPNASQIEQRMQEIVDEFFSLRGPTSAPVPAPPAPTVPAAPGVTTGFKDQALADIAAEQDPPITVEEFRRRFLPP